MSYKEFQEKINQKNIESSKMVSDCLHKIIKLMEEKESETDKALVVKTYYDFSLTLLWELINCIPNKEIKKNTLELTIKALKILEDEDKE